jgi:hypothetical protein
MPLAMVEHMLRIYTTMIFLRKQEKLTKNIVGFVKLFKYRFLFILKNVMTCIIFENYTNFFNCPFFY